jgi:uncharacterized protein (TIGR03435 family)
MRLVTVKTGFVALASIVFAQTPSEQKFEVASVKIMNDGTGGVHGGPGTSSPERITYSGVTLMSLVMKAYKVRGFQVSGPEWLIHDRYEIIANVPSGTTEDGLNFMVQNLLAERFHFRVHHEMKEGPLYHLVVAKGGLKIKESENVRKLSNGQVGSMISPGHVDGQERWIARSASMALLANLAESMLGTFVKDETGLAGYYDFQFDFVDRADPSAQASLASSFADLGLKLQKTTGPIDILVVDSVVKQPTSN